MKSILFALVFITFACAAHAESRCAKEVTQAVTAMANSDFAYTNIVVSIPDMHDMNDQRTETYTADVINADNLNQMLGRYDVMVNETCQIMSGPNRNSGETCHIK
jgi:uncharacterized protein YdiU (UPF0061 family)